MSNEMQVDEILDFAIDREQEAVDFYLELAGRVESPAMKAVFEQFAQEERGHKAKLQGVKAGKTGLRPKGKVLDLKLGDYLVADDPGPDVDYATALVVAMKKEKAAFRLYSDLAAQAGDASIQELFLGLAQEEAKHKLRFEIEYDEHVLTDN